MIVLQLIIESLFDHSHVLNLYYCPNNSKVIMPIVWIVYEVGAVQHCSADVYDSNSNKLTIYSMIHVVTSKSRVQTLIFKLTMAIDTYFLWLTRDTGIGFVAWVIQRVVAHERLNEISVNFFSFVDSLLILFH